MRQVFLSFKAPTKAKASCNEDETDTGARVITCGLNRDSYKLSRPLHGGGEGFLAVHDGMSKIAGPSRWKKNPGVSDR